MTCLIGIQNIFGQVEYIAVTCEGEEVGRVLHEQYKSRDMVANLIREGTRSFLEGPDDILDESGDPSKIAHTHQDFFRIKTHNPQYYYLFTVDNAWVIYSTHLEPHVQHENVLYA